MQIGIIKHSITIYMRIYKIRNTFLVSQTIVLLLAFLYEYIVGKSSDSSFIFVYSIWNALSYGWLFLSEMKYAPDFHPFQVLALTCVQFVGLNGLSIASQLIFGEGVMYGDKIMDDIAYLGVIYLSLEHLILFWVFFFFEKKYFRDRGGSVIIENVRNTPVDYIGLAKKVYVGVWALKIFNYIVPLGSIGSSIEAFVSDGYYVALFLVIFAKLKNPSKKGVLSLYWVIAAIEIVLRLNTGMKEQLLRPLIPYGIYLIISYKAGITSINKKMVIGITILGLFIVSFVFPYISVYRSIAADTGREISEISIFEGFSGYADYLTGSGTYGKETGGRGADYLMSRAGSILYNAWAIDYAKTNGNTPEFFAYCIIAAVPRIVWPGKPPIVTGFMIDRLMAGDPTWLVPGDTSDYSSSATFGFIGALYFSFGLYGAIALVLAHAFYIVFIWNYVRTKVHYNMMAIFILMSLIIQTMKDFESYLDCGVAFVAINTAYIIIVKLIDKRSKKLFNLSTNENRLY